jgi:ketosteroid isomerase-like protein
MTALTRYMDAWVANDVERIVAAVAENCTVTERYGPVYSGRARVREWAEAWFGAGGVVHRWETFDHFVANDREAAQWMFECSWDGKRSVFEGSTISLSQRGLIVNLREYQTTAPLYEWRGSWKSGAR